MIATAAPQPQAGEAYEQYVTRAHRELMQAIPEPEQRNRIVWDAWSAAYGDPERDRATVKFSADRFNFRRDVCYFSEHQTARTGPHGSRWSSGTTSASWRRSCGKITTALKIAMLTRLWSTATRPRLAIATRRPCGPSAASVRSVWE